MWNLCTLHCHVRYTTHVLESRLLHTFVHSAFVVAGVIAIAGAAYFSLPSMKTSASLPRAQMMVHQIPIMVEVAATEESRMQGLSGRSSLRRGDGMIFVFHEPGHWGMWMKDMLFSIDIIWLDRVGKVVAVEKNVAPHTYPKIFESPVGAWYVLELPAGDADHYLIAEGDKFTLPQLQ